MPGILSKVETYVSCLTPPTLIVILLSRTLWPPLSVMLASPGTATGPAKKSVKFFLPSGCFLHWYWLMVTVIRFQSTRGISYSLHPEIIFVNRPKTYWNDMFMSTTYWHKLHLALLEQSNCFLFPQININFRTM